MFQTKVRGFWVSFGVRVSTGRKGNTFLDELALQRGHGPLTPQMKLVLFLRARFGTQRKLQGLCWSNIKGATK